MILTSRRKSFQSTCVLETGFSDFYRMTVSALNMHYRKPPLKDITCRDFSNYDNETFIKSSNEVLNEYENQEDYMILIAFVKYALKFQINTLLKRKNTFGEKFLCYDFFIIF